MNFSVCLVCYLPSSSSMLALSRRVLTTRSVSHSCTCKCTLMYPCINACMYIYTYLHACASTHMHRHTRAHVHARTHAHTRSTCILMHIHTYTHTHTHTHTCCAGKHSLDGAGVHDALDSDNGGVGDGHTARFAARQASLAHHWRLKHIGFTSATATAAGNHRSAAALLASTDVAACRHQFAGQTLAAKRLSRNATLARVVEVEVVVVTEVF